MRITVKHDIQKLVPELDNMKTSVKRATASALNKTIQQTNTQAKTILSSEYTLKSSVINTVLKIYKATKDNLNAMLYATDKYIGFSDKTSGSSAKWKARQLKKGAKVTIKKGSSSVFKHGFIAEMKSGHVGVFERDTTKPSRKVKKVGKDGKVYYSEFPIREMKGPSVSHLFGSKGIMKRLEEFAQNKFPSIFENEFKYFNKK